MNNVIRFYDRQLGTANHRQYDFLLSRLRVHSSDHWKGITPSTYSISDYNPEPPIFSAKFANAENHKHILAIANEDGKIALQDTNAVVEHHDIETSLHGHQCHYNAVFDLEWMPGQMKFVSASGDNTARLWELCESQLIESRVFRGHTRSVKTAAFRKADPAVFATGGRDGAILVWDTRSRLNVDLVPRADNCIYSGHAGGPGTPSAYKRKNRTTPKLPSHVCTSSITGIVFQDDNTLVSCGAGDGLIKVWDLRRNYSCLKREPLPKHSFAYAGSSTFCGFTNLLVDNSGRKLYVNCMDNSIYCYNLADYSSKPILCYQGLKNSTFYIKSCLSPDGQYLASGSSDEFAYIWNVRHPTPAVVLTGHNFEVTCVAWSDASEPKLVTCSDDARHKIWRVSPEYIADDELMQYRGHAECLPQRESRASKSVDRTPRSVRYLIDHNETTPTSGDTGNSQQKLTEVDELPVGSKRTFAEMSYDDTKALPEPKRQHSETPRNRRLFSPSRFELCMHGGISPLENPEPRQPSSSSSSLKENGTLCRPLAERISVELSKLSESGQEPVPGGVSGYFSPTLNLPNYVLDGEAPHLRLNSPKRPLQENVDWLTKIRKERLHRWSAATVTATVAQESTAPASNADKSELCTSRVQTLQRDTTNTANTVSTAAESSQNKSIEMPRRRNSRSDSASKRTTPHTAKVISIRRFFNVQASPACESS